ncbi:MAG: 3-hydroxyacyl-CoA dehydrogenase NAD-binding domain-containing protein [Bacteroidia bacterium]
MKVIIVGCGVMGSGIAISSIRAGYSTTLYDLNEDALQKAESYIHQQLKKAIEKGKMNDSQKDEALSNLSFTKNFNDLVGDLILEAVVEKLEVKQKLFADLESQNSTDCILATNTSSIPITQIGRELKHPERLVGVHFFNPAHIMKLVEIISGAATDDSYVQKAFDWAISLGKKAVLAKDAPGFIVNRVARHYYVESLKALEENVCSHEVMDELMKATGFKMGAFELMDLIGVETNYSVTSSMFEQFNYDAKFRPSRIQKQLADAGFHGRKSKRGFYRYE